MRDLDMAYYRLRDTLPDPTCPDLNVLKEKLRGDEEAQEIIERLRRSHNSLRNAAKASMLLFLSMEESFEKSHEG